jgi:hypothetical protein
MSGVFVIQGEDKLVELEEQMYESEDLLQTLLENYPSLLAGDQINKNAPRRWLLISREAGIPDKEQGGNRWSVDHLFLDQEGVPTLVEVKRSTDTRIRREVIGQLIEYAANAVLYWPVETLKAKFEYTCEQDDVTPDVKLAEFIGSEIDEDEFWGNVESNIQTGKVRLLFVADRIPTELQRVVEFLNEQMNPAEVLAVEIKQFVGEDLRTLVPRVIGQTMEAQDRKQPSTPGIQWDEKTFMERLNDNEKQVARKILGWATDKGLSIWWGKGAKNGSLIPIRVRDGIQYYPVAICTGYKNPYVQIHFEPLSKRPTSDDENNRLELLRRINEIQGVDIPIDAISKYPSFHLSLLESGTAFAKFMETLNWFDEKIQQKSE